MDDRVVFAIIINVMLLFAAIRWWNSARSGIKIYIVWLGISIFISGVAYTAGNVLDIGFFAPICLAAYLVAIYLLIKINRLEK